MSTDTSERGLERLNCTELTGSTCDPGVVPDEGKGSQLLTSLFRMAVYMAWNSRTNRGLLAKTEALTFYALYAHPS